MVLYRNTTYQHLLAYGTSWYLAWCCCWSPLTLVGRLVPASAMGVQHVLSFPRHQPHPPDAAPLLNLLLVLKVMESSPDSSYKG